jgi:hypothetical protein
MKVGVSGYLNDYPLAARFTSVGESQFGNISPDHAEKKLIEEIGRRSNSASSGQVYIFVRHPSFKGICIGCDKSFENFARQRLLIEVCVRDNAGGRSRYKY